MARRKKRGSSRKAKRPANRQVVVVSKTRHRRKRRVSGSIGSTAVGKTHKRRKRRKSGIMGATSHKGMINTGLKMFVGIGGGIIVNHKVLRPLENMATEHHPHLGKAMGVIQAAVGIAIGMHGLKKNKVMVASFGGAVAQGGVNAVLRQFNVEKHIPGIAGSNEDWTTVKVPMGETKLESMVGRLLSDNKNGGSDPDWGKVAGGRHRRNHLSQDKMVVDRHHNVFNDTFSNDSRREGRTSNANDARLTSFVGEAEFDLDMPAKGYNF